MKLRTRTYTGTTSNALTQREISNRLIARRAAAEGFVLLKNEENTLPLKKNTKLGLYGAGAVYTVKGGTGSGDVNERDSVSIYQGLSRAGFEITSEKWLKSYKETYDTARLEWRDKVLKRMEEKHEEFFSAYVATRFDAPEGDSLNIDEIKKDSADTAVYVLRRIAGEGGDRHDVEGDYYITGSEKKILAQVCEAYQKVILVINTGGLVDLGFTDEFSNITAIIQFMQGGQEGGSALADVLRGDITPSGKLVDTWANCFEDYPNADYFSYKSGDVFKEEYKEGIYVGYRYFDTFEVPVRYCFGYGLSYTNFHIECTNMGISGKGTNNPQLNVSVRVKNIGNVYAGKEVIQIYASCPQGSMPKEFRRLIGFAKTKLLAPGEEQTLTVSVSVEQIASYCEAEEKWILESGLYGIWVGNSLNSAKIIGSIAVDNLIVVRECASICPIQHKLEEIVPPSERLAEREKQWNIEAEGKYTDILKSSDIITDVIEYSEIPDVLPGMAGELVESLSLDQLVALATGDPGKGQGSQLGSSGQTVPGAAAETVKIAAEEPWNIASIVLADGPAGLRLNKQYQVDDGKIIRENMMESFENGFFAQKKEKKGTTYYQFCTAIPVGTLLAQSWNLEIVKELGEMIGHEMEDFEVSLWLAPGMNIHRNPLCGRNFEYYSEDPLLAGMIASAMTLGVQRVPGCGTTIKHFACNNQEDNRMGSDSIIHERALREIYLKGFEIAVRNSQPMSMMTSYNLVNGVHAANSYDLCTKAARDEWGFAGAIMTDWTTTTRSTAGACTASGCMRAGNDMVMPGDAKDHENIRQELENGTLDIKELKRCVYNTVNITLQTNQYEDSASYLKQFEGLDTYMTTK